MWYQLIADLTGKSCHGSVATYKTCFLSRGNPLFGGKISRDVLDGY